MSEFTSINDIPSKLMLSIRWTCIQEPEQTLDPLEAGAQLDILTTKANQLIRRSNNAMLLNELDPICRVTR
ncbi:unnamed protein product, partial [Dicrocoelium dendriticum]